MNKEAKYAIIKGYWKNDEEQFDNYLVKLNEEIGEDDDMVFFYFKNEEELKDCIGKESQEDFVIISYELEE